MGKFLSAILAICLAALILGSGAIDGKFDRSWHAEWMPMFGAGQYTISMGRRPCVIYVWADSAELIAMQSYEKGNVIQHLYGAGAGGYQVSVGGQRVPPGDVIGTDVLDPVKENCNDRFGTLPDSTKGQLRKLGLRIN